MSNLAIAAWSFPILLVLIFLRMPIGLAMLVCGFAGSWLDEEADCEYTFYALLSLGCLQSLP